MLLLLERRIVSHLLSIDPGFLGRNWHPTPTSKTPSDKEDSRSGPKVPSGFWQVAHHHFREAGQKGCQVLDQGPTLSLHQQSAIRAQYGHAAWYGMEYARELPTGDTAQGRQEGLRAESISICSRLSFFSQMGRIIEPLEKLF
jgi:hypothetical protein